MKLERTQALLDYFAAHTCVDCGEADPVVLDFDHLRDKAFDVSAAYTHKPWATVLEEIEKCEVVCSNCHRRRTAQRIGALKLLLLGRLEAGDENRTRTESLEGSRAAVTPRPQEGQ